MSSDIFWSKLASKDKPYCVYLILYRGKELPPFYIGATSVENIKENYYFGSVSSKKWAKTWKKELSENRNLFKRKIIRTFDTRSEAAQFEEYILTHFDGSRSFLFVNMTNGNLNFTGGQIGNQNAKGHIKSQEAIEAQSSKIRGRKQSPVHVRKKAENKRRTFFMICPNGNIQSFESIRDCIDKTGLSKTSIRDLKSRSRNCIRGWTYVHLK